MFLKPACKGRLFVTVRVVLFVFIDAIFIDTGSQEGRYMVKAEEILSMEYLKKTEFTGSSEGMRYRLEKLEKKSMSDNGEERTDKYLLCTIWPEPFNFHTTPEEEKESAEFSFDRDGVEDAVAWMNDRLFAEHEKFSAAPGRWTEYKMG